MVHASVLAQAEPGIKGNTQRTAHLFPRKTYPLANYSNRNLHRILSRTLRYPESNASVSRSMPGEVRFLDQNLGLETLQTRGESDASIPPKDSGQTAKGRLRDTNAGYCFVFT
jgi:hypothetical protein